MTNLLTELLNAGLIEKLDGDDGRFSKIEQAAKVIAQELREQPPQLIRAILAGLDPDIADDDPIIVRAEQALTEEWKSVHGIFPDGLVNMLRAILLDACNQVAAEDNNAAILWLSAADTLPLLRLGREETVIRRLLGDWARIAEEQALAAHTLTAIEEEQVRKIDLKFTKTTSLEPPKVNRAALLTKVEGAVGPHNQQSQAAPDPNPHWPNSPQHWAWQFAPRMQKLMADELDGLATKFSESQLVEIKEVQTYVTKLTKSVSESLVAQQKKVEKIRQADQIRLNSLWWSEALYSSSLRCSYRELTPVIATVAMAVDLLNEVSNPTTASVGYLLAEAVNRLPDASFNQKFTLQALLEALGSGRALLSSEWLVSLDVPAEAGRISLRDGVVLVITNKAHDVVTTLKRMGANSDFEMSLPEFAHALFRQEQAVQLAGVSNE
ncbi:GTPase-associated system all-helical protein GASH [Sideroxyarcus sp. TK5]